MSKPKIIAFYLPQFHPTPDNDMWWGKGFTEWTNVGKAKPLFKGHYQPKVPADLGYYDLRLPEVREEQARLAREAGIYGFCYYHYWFGNGKQELELPFNEVLESGKPDFPFMLCWANVSWHKKFWNNDSVGSSIEMLVKQTYPGIEDIERHFYNILPALKDKRYIRIDGKPLFMIYNTITFGYGKDFLDHWQKLAVANGLPGISFITQRREDLSLALFDKLFSDGFQYINTERLRDIWFKNLTASNRLLRKFKQDYLGFFANKIDYLKAVKSIINEMDNDKNIIPTIIPNWDHTPRSGKNGFVFTNSTPENFKKHCKEMLHYYHDKPFIFLKSWNEWGEGNYIEPDLKYGHGYLDALRESLNELK